MIVMKTINIYKNILLLIGLISFVGSLVYYFYSLNILGIFITFILVILVYLIILRFIPDSNTKDETQKSKTNQADRFFLFISAALFAFSFGILIKTQTGNSLISPWQTIPYTFFVLLFLYFIILLYQIFSNRKFFIINLSLFCFLVFSIAITVFPLGFGFDPFIHQATLELIEKEGAVNPKPLYYLGEYSLLTIINTIPFTSLKLIHYYLIPLLTALFLPFLLFRTLSSWLKDDKTIKLSILFLLIIPFGIFTISTPQNLAWLFLLLTVIIGIKCNNYRDLTLMLALSFAAITTQAIAGLPALFFTLLIAIHHSNLKNKKLLIGLNTMLMAIILPLVFFFLNGGKLALNNASFFANLSFLSLHNPNTENIILNTIYLYINNFPILIFIMIISGLYLANRHKQHCPSLYLYLLSTIAMFTSYLLLLRLDFGYLIDYEQTNFANRILITVAIFSLPFIILSLYKFFEQLQKQNKFIQISFFLFLNILILFSVYASFPRFDHYHNSHAYTVGQNDINAVNWIESDADKQDYIVLANQQVSASALHEFGFKKYYSTDIFYYPCHSRRAKRGKGIQGCVV
jgi:hypothetical protein